MEGNALLVVQLAMAASLSAQGVAVDVTAIKIVAIYYYVITPDTTSASAGRRLLVSCSCISVMAGAHPEGPAARDQQHALRCITCSASSGTLTASHNECPHAQRH